MSAKVAGEAIFGTGKLVGLMALGPAAYLGGIQGARFYHNITSDESDNKAHKVDDLRKESVANRLSAGSLGHFNAKYLEKHLKTNSALQRHADSIRQKHAEATR